MPIWGVKHSLFVIFITVLESPKKVVEIKWSQMFQNLTPLYHLQRLLLKKNILLGKLKLKIIIKMPIWGVKHSLFVIFITVLESPKKVAEIKWSQMFQDLTPWGHFCEFAKIIFEFSG